MRHCACGCGAPGEPCLVWNRVDADTEPELPEGFVVDIRKSPRELGLALPKCRGIGT